MRGYEKAVLAACAIPAAFVLSAWLYYPVLGLGERLGLFGDPPHGDVLGFFAVIDELRGWAPNA